MSDSGPIIRVNHRDSLTQVSMTQLTLRSSFPRGRSCRKDNNKQTSRGFKPAGLLVWTDNPSRRTYQDRQKVTMHRAATERRQRNYGAESIFFYHRQVGIPHRAIEFAIIRILSFQPPTTPSTNEVSTVLPFNLIFRNHDSSLPATC